MDTALTPELWDRVRTSEQLLEQVPEWVQVVLSMSFDEISLLPTSIRNTPFTRPSAECHALDESYLDFLREQIALNARGREWSNRLEKRLKARENYVGCEMLYLRFSQLGKDFSLTLLYPSLQIVDWETYDFYWNEPPLG